MPRTSVNKPDNYCYVCGEVTFASQKPSITTMVKKAYHLYFGCKIGDQDKMWAQPICCNTCATNFRQWLNRNRKSMPFAVQMIWKEPTDHISICYFCMAPPVGKGVSKKKSRLCSIQTFHQLYAQYPTEKDCGFLMHQNHSHLESDEGEDETSGPEPSRSHDLDFLPSSSSEPHLITQGELKDLVRNLELPKRKAELLGSRLQQWNILAGDVRVSMFHDHQKDLVTFFFMKGDLVACNIDGVMAALNIVHDPNEWRLFIDSSKMSLKAVLLHNGNVLPSIPVGHAAHMKETYDNMKQFLRCINYDQHRMQLCGDFKVVALLLGLQTGYTKYCCFLFELDSRARDSHYIKIDWPLRPSLEPGRKSVQHPPLVESRKILLPPFHIKLGLIKNFVKAIDKTQAAFKYIREKFPRLSEAKIKEGVFVGPQIRELLRDDAVDSALRGKEKTAWKAFQLVATDFRGNNKADNYRELVETRGGPSGPARPSLLA
ncbi:uncharacterized protein LOC133349820 isoform X1 [Lethenteron reissneri]|uniref:uncharacterized protein LOC133349820 isoform X1 n=1 Tax=Lethenteron reissneri TaxID=7753 RepID=UPI002AB71E54|nr:uncharacterized protein LOC133349820 isoform X1 [Lethenteron reissneri]